MDSDGSNYDISSRIFASFKVSVAYSFYNKRLKGCFSFTLTWQPKYELKWFRTFIIKSKQMHKLKSQHGFCNTRRS